ncbi:hypothetical protein [Stenotrophomonas maltophilia]|uniref:hypothetical protein n=1 Tax=Stenotrophomonas maltophilia TaxID=40324 RepID=UPI0015DE5C84|nr:hypothetical protein [Stenotrophomonas maltophilia]MBA0447957.1 hypothetical protein [Stenotrophomonas maltophilia]
MQMLGNPATFALEFSVDAPALGYGRARMWCAGQPLGMLSGGVYLDGYVRGFLQDLLRLPPLPAPMRALSASEADAALLRALAAWEPECEDADAGYARAQRHLLACGDLLDEWEVLGWLDSPGQILIGWRPPGTRSRRWAAVSAEAVAAVEIALRDQLVGTNG